MVAQLFWLSFSYAAVFAFGGAVLELGSLWGGVAVFLGVPAVRIGLRFRQGKGYFVLGRSGDGVDRPHRTITRRAFPVRFTVLLCAELAVLAFLAGAIVTHPSFWEITAVRHFLHCQMGPGLAEMCLR